MNRALIVFLKKPEPGKVKTRLAKGIGEEAASQVYQKLLNHHLSWIKELNYSTYAFHEGFEDPPSTFLSAFDHWIPQTDGDLGVRMLNAFETVFHFGADQALIIGTDCPEINPELLDKAFDQLLKQDACFGPSLDGGYYLLGLKKAQPELFLDMEWSNEKVLLESLSRADQCGLTHGLLDQLRDIDEPEDLEHFPEFQP